MTLVLKIKTKRLDSNHVAEQIQAELEREQKNEETGSLDGKLFSAKDVEAYLGIDPKTLNLWVKRWRLVRPEIEDGGRGSKRKFSLENMATLSLLKILKGCHLDLPVLGGLINNILNEDLDVSEIKEENGKTKFLLNPEKFNLWTYYRVDPEHLKKSGFYLLLSMPLNGRENEIGYSFGDLEEIVALMQRMRKSRKDFKDFAGIIVIDLIAIISDLEEKSGLTF